MELAGVDPEHGEGEGDESGRPRRRGQGELATEVLSVLHRAPGPVTASWVQEQLGGELAYTTVMTILSRLLAKQAVVRSRAGRAYVWAAAADAAGLTARRMRRMLDTEPDRDAVLASFVTALTPEDEQLLRSLLNAAEPSPGAGGRDDGR
ncbi:MULTISPECIES: BlaI/MecI/CopY family transcriptional regulator [Kitasatospora]|uniref:Putative BlaI family transcriptional regulator n=1 Tax=Kitasatospora setae (strain ATCC 33774 / DSM 43861 / JCM 3304 / KCC A-0304 / NBRC 14216 / KM-6054) TaxID=452652 RepID=E4N4A8_KITSK|nr:MULTISPECIES: BlaI/MecI/CopY family transcriptional regulator [Kitasatospora]BAJ26039.1 putative BlaI family transcriptional regulator [Kitasatospora setae KM-6054]